MPLTDNERIHGEAVLRHKDYKLQEKDDEVIRLKGELHRCHRHIEALKKGLHAKMNPSQNDRYIRLLEAALIGAGLTESSVSAIRNLAAEVATDD